MEKIKLSNNEYFTMVFIDGFYRYVNHEKGLLTTGFATADKLDEYKYLIRFDNGTIKIMSDRYNKNYPLS